MAKYIDVIMHSKQEVNGDKEEVTAFPITRYDNVLNAPCVKEKDIEGANNPEFMLLITETEVIDDSIIYNMLNIEW